MKIEIRSSVINGNLKRNREQIKQAIASFEGKEIIITIDKAKKTRSNNQNNFYQQEMSKRSYEPRKTQGIKRNVAPPATIY